jgi:hypothetical protein
MLYLLTSLYNHAHIQMDRYAQYTAKGKARKEQGATMKIATML